MRIHDTTFGDELREAIGANIDGFERRVGAAGSRRAAVAITIVERADGSAGFVITRRAPHLKNHPGQWALPGGSIDEGETAEEAALRELGEEVRVVVGEDAVLGMLDDYVTRSGFAITPVVVWAGAVELVPDPSEVDLALALPLADLDRDDAPLLERIPESDRPVIMMPLMGSVVFAPTAALLFQFREVGLRGTPTRVAHFEQPVFAWR